jgi:hypothetical protein
MIALCCLDAVSVRYLRELIDLLAVCLAELGHEVRLVVGELDPGATNIVLDSYKAASPELFAGRRYVVYQLEQLSPGCRFLTAASVRALRNALAVWDFAAENAALLAALGIRAEVLPVGWHPAMATLPATAAADKDIDVLFYGSLNRRREAVLSRLAREPVRLKILEGVFGAERDAFVARSRLVLSIHYFEAKLLEIVRISHLLANRAFVLAEEAESNPYAGLGLATAPYRELAGRCLDWLADGPALEAARGAVADRFAATLPMTPLLAPLAAALPDLAAS